MNMVILADYVQYQVGFKFSKLILHYIAVNYQNFIFQTYQNRLHIILFAISNSKQLFDFQSEYDLFANMQTAH